jgi:hypothetical protein
MSVGVTTDQKQTNVFANKIIIDSLSEVKLIKFEKV